MSLQVLVLGREPWIWILSKELVSEAACDHLSCPSRAKALTYPLVSDRAFFPLTNKIRTAKSGVTAESASIGQPFQVPTHTSQAHIWGLLFSTSVETSELRLNLKAQRLLCGPKDLSSFLTKSKWGPDLPGGRKHRGTKCQGSVWLSTPLTEAPFIERCRLTWEVPSWLFRAARQEFVLEPGVKWMILWFSYEYKLNLAARL